MVFFEKFWPFLGTKFYNNCNIFSFLGGSDSRMTRFCLLVSLLVILVLFSTYSTADTVNLKHVTANELLKAKENINGKFDSFKKCQKRSCQMSDAPIFSVLQCSAVLRVFLSYYSGKKF